MSKPVATASAVAILLSLLAFSPAAAQSCWVSAGASTDVYAEDLTYAIRDASNLDVGTYPVTVDGILSVDGIGVAPGAGNSKSLVVRYRDNGPEARIILRLRQVDIVTGASTVLITFDSDNYPAQSTYQTRGICLFGVGGFDFNNYMYFLKVEATRSGAGGTTAFQIVQACTANC